MNRPAVRRSPNAAHRQVSSRRGVYKSFKALSLDACRPNRISHVPGSRPPDKHPESEFYLSGGLGFSRPLDKYPESEFYLSGGLRFSRPPDTHPDSELDLSSGLGFSRPLDKHPVNEFE